MRYHLAAAFLFWSLGLLHPTLPDEWIASSMIAGLIAFLLFIKESRESVRFRYLDLAAKAEQKGLEELTFFTGRFVEIKDGVPPLNKDFTYIVFYNGEYEIPLFCRNTAVAQKAALSRKKIRVYYEDYILVDIEEVG
ncbi:hypothetical protein DRW41_04380 [Neobacillus piezotolerans]|uniref:Uncharacterized protein n=1 Tax=Neobacillus piezotolerans TaxID=2259171 RepID=A0A3D8GWP1_9BACI|nr:hypothetical protein [Neobacillus piezotolerans]RDU38802.1 hypothetical protein DRW41_04380 [Neobacillus piezotolerans]